MIWNFGSSPQMPTRAKGYGRKSRAAMAAAAAAAGLVLMGAPAATAEPAGISHDFLVYGADGNTYITGTVFFSNRSASVKATRSTSTHCNSTTGKTSLSKLMSRVGPTTSKSA
jgi:ABC-type sugar transport system substrate-binding protein